MCIHTTKNNEFVQIWETYKNDQKCHLWIIERFWKLWTLKNQWKVVKVWEMFPYRWKRIVSVAFYKDCCRKFDSRPRRPCFGWLAPARRARSVRWVIEWTPDNGAPSWCRWRTAAWPCPSREWWWAGNWRCCWSGRRMSGSWNWNRLTRSRWASRWRRGPKTARNSWANAGG